MTLRTFIILTTLLLSACSNKESSNAEQAYGHVEMEKIRYECVNFKPIEVRFFPHHGVAVLVLNNETHELQEQVSASGYWYSNGRYSIRGKNRELSLEIGRSAPIECIPIL